MKQPLILAIDTSCDETSVAVTRGRTVLSNVVASQVELHKPYGGVFPTVAKLAHRENLAPALMKALKQARVAPQNLEAVAVTVGPGLAPALETGITFAQAFATEHKLALIPANHLEGHIVSVLAQPQQRTTSDKSLAHARQPAAFTTSQLPALAMIVSGGNTLFVQVEALEKSGKQPLLHDGRQVFDRQPRLQLDTLPDQTPWRPAFRYTILGQTLDDAAGECLDKVGRLLNLGYPAGPIVEEFAKLGHPERFPFPLPLTQVKTYDVSFSGIKTHSRHLIDAQGGIDQFTKQDVYDFCAGLQAAVFRHLTYKLERLLNDSPVTYQEFWLSGGVAANMALRQALRVTLCHYINEHTLPRFTLRVPYTKKLCGDNAAMIGVAASFAA